MKSWGTFEVVRLDGGAASGRSAPVALAIPGRYSHGESSPPLEVNMSSTKVGTVAVSDIDAARADLMGHGVEVSEAFHLEEGPVPAPAPQGRSHNSW